MCGSGRFVAPIARPRKKVGGGANGTSPWPPLGDHLTRATGQNRKKNHEKKGIPSNAEDIQRRKRRKKKRGQPQVNSRGRHRNAARGRVAPSLVVASCWKSKQNNENGQIFKLATPVVILDCFDGRKKDAAPFKQPFHGLRRRSRWSNDDSMIEQQLGPETRFAFVFAVPYSIPSSCDGSARPSGPVAPPVPLLLACYYSRYRTRCGRFSFYFAEIRSNSVVSCRSIEAPFPSLRRRSVISSFFLVCVCVCACVLSSELLRLVFLCSRVSFHHFFVGRATPVNGRLPLIVPFLFMALYRAPYFPATGGGGDGGGGGGGGALQIDSSAERKDERKKRIR